MTAPISSFAPDSKNESTLRTLQEAHELLSQSSLVRKPVRRIVTRVEQYPGDVKFLAVAQAPVGMRKS